MQSSSPVFICGHAKSGTTLLLALLDRHPDLVVFPEETFFFKRIMGHPEKQNADYILRHTGPNLLRHGEIDDRHGHRDYTSIDFLEYEKSLRRYWNGSDGTERSLLESLVFGYAEATGQTGRKYWVEKSPSNEAYLDKALACWPGLHAIYIVRDPRDNYCSYRSKRLSDSATFTPEDFIMNWCSSIHAWERFTVHNVNGLLIRYDELVQHPQAVMQRICDFLQIDWDDILMLPTRNGVFWPGNSMYGTAFKGVSADSLGKYRDLLTPDEICYLETWLGTIMARYGWHAAHGTFSLRRMTQSLLTGGSGSPMRKLRMIRNLWRVRSSIVGKQTPLLDRRLAPH